MKLLVCGSRTIDDAIFIKNAIDTLICDQNWNKQDITIIQGEAKGVDSIAKLWAKFNKLPVESYPAEWDKYGKRAGFIRNEVMVKLCDYCLILWDGESHGTKNDIELCKKHNKPYKLIIYGGNECQPLSTKLQQAIPTTVTSCTHLEA